MGEDLKKGAFKSDFENGGVVEDENGRWNEGAKVSGAMNRIWKVRSLDLNAKRKMYERIVMPSVLYIAETDMRSKG